MSPTPAKIRRLAEAGIEVHWTDGEVQQLSSKLLRSGCPCAECREERGDLNHQRPISPAGTQKKGALRIIDSDLNEQLSLQEIWSVGNYALGLRWADDHSTGIYTFSYLYELGKNASSADEKVAQSS